MKIFILTAGYGEGHNSAARALQAAFNEVPGVEADFIDIFALHAPCLNTISRKFYLRLINTAPKIWSWIYRWLDRSAFVPTLFRALAGHRNLLGRLIAEKRPVAIVSTYPIYGWLLNQLAREGRLPCPHFTVITDALTINSLWYRTPAESWFVTDPDSAAYLHAKGVPAARVHVSGFPVAPGFADRPRAWQPAEPVVAPAYKILFMINSGRSASLKIARALLTQRHWHITITAGRDLALRQKLEKLALKAAGKAEVLGWTDRIPELLMTHHVVISKAGGATTQESINALCPLLVSQIVPGQEEGNYELIRRHETGALADTPETIVATLEKAFARNAALWHHWRANLKKIAHPAAARDIAQHVLKKINRDTAAKAQDISAPIAAVAPSA